MLHVGARSLSVHERVQKVTTPQCLMFDLDAPIIDIMTHTGLMMDLMNELSPCSSALKAVEEQRCCEEHVLRSNSIH